MAAVGQFLSRVLLILAPIAAIAAPGENKEWGMVTESRIEADSTSGDNWLTYGRTYSEQRFSPLSQIDDTNVKRLGLAWSADVPSRDGLGATPLVVDGVIYLSGNKGLVEARKADSGKKIWSFRPEKTEASGVFSAWTSRSNRGVAVWKGKVFVATGDCRLFALAADSGRVVWEVPNCDVSAGYGSDGAPRVARDLVLIGNGGADNGTRGYLSAYDAESGKLHWRFYTVPGDPSKGFEQPILKKAAATWSGDQWWKSGGGSVWDSIVYDPELDQIYFGTDSTTPWNVKVRNPKGGDNWFTNSIVAVDAKTGQYRWHYQEVPADAWDYNATPSIVVADLRVNGRDIKALLQAPKDGFFYVIDRTTGKLVSAAPFVKVSWASKIDLKTGRPVEVPAARYYLHPQQRAMIFPSIEGAHNWQAMSYSPLTGLAYIPALNAPSSYYVVGGKPDGFGWADLYVPGPNEHPQPRGELIAWDPIRQQARWSIELKYPYNGGTLATAGNLVFQGTAEGNFTARKADTGELLWSTRLGSATQAPPVTFRQNGIQYVLLPVGASGVPRLYLPEYGAPPSAQGPTRLVAFALDAKGVIDTTVLTKPELPKPPAQFASRAEIAKGASLYQEAECMTCHGARLDVPAGGSAPDLRYLSPEIHAIWNSVVIDGALTSAGMPAFKDALSPSDAQAIRAYVIDEAQKLYSSKKQGSATTGTSGVK